VSKNNKRRAPSRGDLMALRAAARQMLEALSTACDGCDTALWAGYENGHGDECGKAIDAAAVALDAALSQRGGP
jgi:hypothetical protein